MKKSFSEMTKAERESLSDKEWKAVPPHEKKSCHDCKWCVGYVSLWCTNDEAAKVRGTKIPGCYNCDFWEPERKTVCVETTRESIGLLGWLKRIFY